MKVKGYLLIAGSVNFFIAALNVIAIFVGAPAYYFLEAPELAVYSTLGSTYPAWLTLLITLFFFISGFYAFCSAGTKVKLPMQNRLLKIFAVIFTLRGMAVFWYIYEQVRAPSESPLKQIVFSFLSLMIGTLFWVGSSKKGTASSAGS